MSASGAASGLWRGLQDGCWACRRCTAGIQKGKHALCRVHRVHCKQWCRRYGAWVVQGAAESAQTGGHTRPDELRLPASCQLAQHIAQPVHHSACVGPGGSVTCAGLQRAQQVQALQHQQAGHACQGFPYLRHSTRVRAFAAALGALACTPLQGSQRSAVRGCMCPRLGSAGLLGMHAKGSGDPDTAFGDDSSPARLASLARSSRAPTCLASAAWLPATKGAWAGVLCAGHRPGSVLSAGAPAAAGGAARAAGCQSPPRSSPR